MKTVLQIRGNSISIAFSERMCAFPFEHLRLLDPDAHRHQHLVARCRVFPNQAHRRKGVAESGSEGYGGSGSENGSEVVVLIVIVPVFLLFR